MTNDIENSMVLPYHDDDAIGVEICETCGQEYPDDAYCKACGIPRIKPIDVKVQELDKTDMAYNNWLANMKFPTDRVLYQAFLAGTSHGLDLSIEQLRKRGK